MTCISVSAADCGIAAFAFLSIRDAPFIRITIDTNYAMLADITVANSTFIRRRPSTSPPSAASPSKKIVFARSIATINVEALGSVGGSLRAEK